jgi:hypothetical protein
MRASRHHLKAVTGAGAVVLASIALLSGCGSASVDSGGLTSGQRHDAQAALDSLSGSNIPVQLVAISDTVEKLPAACRVHLVSTNPSTFKVYLFWIPFLGSESYTWLNMTIGQKASQDSFHLATQQPVLPGGLLSPNGQGVVPWTQDTNLLSRYGPAQAKKSHDLLVAHSENTLSRPGANCQVLTNGDLRLLPASTG